MSSENKILLRKIIGLSIILLLILIPLLHDEVLLDNSAIKTYGIIYKTKNQKKNSISLFVHFKFKNIEYESRDIFGYNVGNHHRINVNDSVIVEFLEDEPEVNRFDLIRKK